MKLILSMALATGLIATTTTSKAQVYVSAHIGFGVPVHRVYCAPPPPPPVVYEEAPAPVVYQETYPDAVYYNYPAWQGHYRDRCYYEHYRPIYERERRCHERDWDEDHDRGCHRGHAWGHYKHWRHDDDDDEQ